MPKIYIPNKPFYEMDLDELKAYFIRITDKLERKRKTRRRLKSKRKRTAKK